MTDPNDFSKMDEGRETIVEGLIRILDLLHEAVELDRRVRRRKRVAGFIALFCLLWAYASVVF